jgi:pyruvate,water dikinase
VADITNPDWNAMLRRAVCIVTNKGGRTSHASIVARELGIHAVVGTGNATQQLTTGQIVTVSCAEGEEGYVYEGTLEWREQAISLKDVPKTRTKPMLILADPGRALALARYPNAGVGLLRMEFIISNSIRIHPMALVKFNELPDNQERKAIAAIASGYRSKQEYFVETLAEAVALVAAAFYPRDVIVRMSDFKTNEYAQLIGGKQFEPKEENPMLGFRGASRYYHPRYREGFLLECAAMRVVREDMGLANVKLMIPFCRTLEEGRKVIATMAEAGLKQGKDGLEIYVMAELPSNVLLAEEFAQIFDGFSIGSNDLTQLTLGIDRDSATVSELFDENNPAVTQLLARVIAAANKAGKKIGLCGQAPSDYPAFARFLVERGIDSISFNADALLTGIENIHAAETADKG